MTHDHWIVEAHVDERGLSLDELCRACAVSAEWVFERVQTGLLAPSAARDESAAAWRFDAAVLLRVRSMRRIELDFDAGPELAALVADLEDEIRRLRARAVRR